jgi:hypothetical protein
MEPFNDNQSLEKQFAQQNSRRRVWFKRYSDDVWFKRYSDECSATPHFQASLKVAKHIARIGCADARSYHHPSSVRSHPLDGTVQIGSAHGESVHSLFSSHSQSHA